MLTIEVYMDHVILCGQLVKRPEGVARSKWMAFWEDAKALEKGFRA